MPKQVQHRRGTTAQHSSFTGALAEWTHDTSLTCIRVHDASTAGGFITPNTASSMTTNGLLYATAGARFATSSSLTWDGTTLTVDGDITLTGAQTIQTSTGNLTISTAAGNGNVVVTPHGTGVLVLGGTQTLQSSAGTFTLNSPDGDVYVQGGTSGTRFFPRILSRRTIAGMTELINLMFGHTSSPGSNPASIDIYSTTADATGSSKMELGIRKAGEGNGLRINGDTTWYVAGTTDNSFALGQSNLRWTTIWGTTVSNTSTLTISTTDNNGNLVLSVHGTGKVGVGAVTNSALFGINATFTGADESYFVRTLGTVNANANERAGLARFGGTIVEAGSGTHDLLVGVSIFAPTVTGAAGAVTNTAVLYIDQAMSATVSGENYAIWVDGGACRFDGAMRFGTHSALGGETVSGFITITDAGGASRKLAVVS